MAGRHGRKDEILATFIRHVAERGYDQTNLGDIADELGMSKGTIVHHFGTKAQILRDLEESYMNRRQGEVDRLWERLPSPTDRVAAIIYATALYQVTDRDATIATQREVIQLADDPKMRKIRTLRAQIQQRVRDEIAVGVESGVFRRVDPGIATMQVFGAGQWMWTWFRPDGPSTPQVIGATMVDIVLGGLLVDRYGLAELAAPEGRVATIVREVLEATPQQ